MNTFSDFRNPLKNSDGTVAKSKAAWFFAGFVGLATITTVAIVLIVMAVNKKKNSSSSSSSYSSSSEASSSQEIQSRLQRLRQLQQQRKNYSAQKPNVVVNDQASQYPTFEPLDTGSESMAEL
jgi:uncharacterized protein YlxW (UPF0749 family)